MALFGRNSRSWSEDGRTYSIEEDERGIPGYVKNKYDESVEKTGKWFGGSLLSTLATGCCKGVLVTLVTAATLITLITAFQTVGASPGISWEEGITRGLQETKSFLGQGLGMMFLTLGGALGIGADITKRQNKISQEVAEEKALLQELTRSRAPQKAVEVENAPSPKGFAKEEPAPVNDAAMIKWLAAELERRQANQAGDRHRGA